MVHSRKLVDLVLDHYYFYMKAILICFLIKEQSIKIKFHFQIFTQKKKKVNQVIFWIA